MGAVAAKLTNVDQTRCLIYHGTATVTGDAFFHALVGTIATAMRVRYAFIAEFTNDNTAVRTLAFWADNDYRANLEYELAGTPCEVILSGTTCCHPQDIQARFPTDKTLADLSAESYLAVPLISGTGQVLGQLAILDDVGLAAPDNALSLLKTFATRAARELDYKRIERARQRAEAALKQSEQRLASILESAMDAIITIDKQHRIMLFNSAAEQVFRCSADRALGERFDRFLSGKFRNLLDEHLKCSSTVRKQVWAPEGITALRADGEEFPIELVISPVEMEEVFFHAIFLRDVNEREEAERALRELRLEHRKWQEEISRRVGLGNIEIIGDSVEIQSIWKIIGLVANTDATVLLNGETGTGKELIAKALHNGSTRKDKMLIIVNCAALPSELIESDLFGHEVGAFTGATTQRTGRFELADGGTIFLDEIGELTPRAQVKLLRVLQEQTFERVGGSQTIEVNVRVIAATNRNIEAMVETGTFRDDLFYRLNVFPIRVPPLREHKSDIPLLASAFLQRLARKLGKQFDGISPDSMEQFMQYPWPGNVRELQNTIERAAIVSSGGMIVIDDLLTARPRLGATITPSNNTGTLREIERQHIQHVLEQCGWVVEGQRGAAMSLGLNPSTLRLRMHKLGIKRP